MTTITLDIKKSVEQNAGIYFEKAKKAKKKLEGATEALEKSRKKLRKAEKEIIKKEKAQVKKTDRKPEWYEKFRWFFSSEGFLVLGGRDATSNEIVIKKHTDNHDLVFHTDMAGSPFFVIKTKGKKPSEITLNEAAQATASYSRAWKLGLSILDVFYVNPDQVSKTANSGEYMAKGAFMIRGKTNYLKPNLEIGIGIKEGVIIAGPLSAVKKNAEKFIVVSQGNRKASDTAKKIQKQLEGGSIDEIIRMLPAGGCEIRKR